jgi:hypothetical protein
MRSEIRRLAHVMASIVSQGSRILHIHLFKICTANCNEGYNYLTTVNLVLLVRQAFPGSADNWLLLPLQPGMPHLQKHQHLDDVICVLQHKGSASALS